MLPSVVRRTPVSLMLSALLLSVVAGRSHAQAVPPADSGGAISPRCRSPEFRQFDFWLGEWQVRSPAGQLAGHNDVRSVSGGCALVEQWTGAAGGSGVSINTYDADRKRWTQRWVGDGATLWLEGALEAGAMVLRGTAPRQTPRGAVLDRITWTPLPDGSVRQAWDISPDGGATWTPAFVGIYRRAGERR